MFSALKLLSFHYNHRLQPRHQLRQACVMHHIYHLLCILVCLGSLFGQEVLAMDAHSNTACIKLGDQFFASDRFLGGVTALATPGTVTAGAEALLHRSL